MRAAITLRCSGCGTVIRTKHQDSASHCPRNIYVDTADIDDQRDHTAALMEAAILAHRPECEYYSNTLHLPAERLFTKLARSV